MEFSFIGATALPGLYAKMDKEAKELNRQGNDVQSIRGLRKLLTLFEGKVLDGHTSQNVDRLITITFFFRLDWFLLAELQYLAPRLHVICREEPRSDNNSGIMSGSLEDWLTLSKVGTSRELSERISFFTVQLTQLLAKYI